MVNKSTYHEKGGKFVKHNKSKARALIGQYIFYYLPMGERWRKLARTQSNTRQLLRDYNLFLRQSL